MLNTLVYKLAIDALCNDLNPVEGEKSPTTAKTSRKRKKERKKNNKKIRLPKASEHSRLSLEQE